MVIHNCIPLYTTIHNYTTKSDSFNTCREVCLSLMSVNKRGQMVATTDPIQSSNAKRRRYQRSWLLNRVTETESTDSETDAENDRNRR